MLCHSGFFLFLDVFYKCVGGHGYDRDCLCIGPVHAADFSGCVVAVHDGHHNIHDYVKEHGRFPVMDTFENQQGDVVIGTGDSNGYIIRYTFSE